MKTTKTKIWLGVGAYVLSGLATVIEPAFNGSVAQAQTSSTVVCSAVSSDGGGEGGEGNKPTPIKKAAGGGEGDESTPKAKMTKAAGGGEGDESTPKAKVPLAPGVEQAALDQATKAYKVYVEAESESLVKGVKTFTDAVIAGNLKAAQAAYAPSRVSWERIEPVAELFPDFDKSIDARKDDFPKGEKDSGWTGFHRLELELFKNKSTKGMAPVAKKLMADTLGLQRCIGILVIEPNAMVKGSAELIEEVAKTKITGEEDRYSRTDLWDFKANVDGSQKIVDLLRPIVSKVNPSLLKRIDAGFAQINKDLATYADPKGGFVSYEKLNATDKKRMQATLAQLAEDLSQLGGTLGV